MSLRKKLAAVAAVPLAAVAVSVASASPAAAATGWNAATTGAAASGSYYFANGRVYISGRICDNLRDSREAIISLYFNQSWKGPARYEHVHTSGYGNCVSFAFNSQHTRNLRVGVGTENYWDQYNVQYVYLYR